MRFTEAIKVCLSKYAVFSGRAARPEYWWFALFVFTMSVVLSVIDQSVFGSESAAGYNNGLLPSLFQLAVFLPLLAAGWRRMHDSCRPGWLILLPFLMSLAIAVFVFAGIWSFSLLQTAGIDPETLRGPASYFGFTGLVIASALQLVFGLLMIWWLTRPSDPQENNYGQPALKT